jgi:hypothetical protein
MDLNAVLWIGFLILDLIVVLVMFRLFGKAGLIAFIVISIITCNLQVVKLIEIFGIETTLGNIAYGGIFLSTDLINELYGKRESRRAVWIGFAAILVVTIYMQIAIWFKPSPHDALHPSIESLFSVVPRVVIASLIAYLTSQMHDVWSFQWWRQRFSGRYLWLRNNVSTATSQLIDTVVFTLLAFAPLPVLGAVPGFESWATVISVMVTTYVIKLLISLVDTPFIYFGVWLAKRVNGPQGTTEETPSR